MEAQPAAASLLCLFFFFVAKQEVQFYSSPAGGVDLPPAVTSLKNKK